MLRKLTDLLAWFGESAKRRRGPRALAGLKDRELADVGLVPIHLPRSPRDIWARQLPKIIEAICCGWRGDAIPQGCRQH